jgi:hypothetical protein
MISTALTIEENEILRDYIITEAALPPDNTSDFSESLAMEIAELIATKNITCDMAVNSLKLAIYNILLSKYIPTDGDYTNLKTHLNNLEKIKK